MGLKMICAVSALAVLLAACGGNDDSTSSSAEVKAPTNLKAEPLDGAAHLTWQDNSDNEAEFMIERKSGSADFTTVATVPFNTTQYHDAGLQASMTYVYRVMAMPKEGDEGSYSNEATCSLPAKNVATTASGGTAAPAGTANNTTGSGGTAAPAGTANNTSGSGAKESSSAGRAGGTAADQARSGGGATPPVGGAGHAATSGSVAAESGGSSGAVGASGHGGAAGVGGTSSGTAGGASGHDAHH